MRGGTRPRLLPLAPEAPPPCWREGRGEEGQESVTKFPWQLRGAISSLSNGIGRCPLAAISMATRSGSSLGKWDTSFHDDERMGEPSWRSPIFPIIGRAPPLPQLTRVRRGGAAQHSKGRAGVLQSELGAHQSSLSPSWSRPITLRLPQVQGSPSSSNTSVQMNVQVLCGEAGRGLGHPHHSPGPRAAQRGGPAAPTPRTSCRFQ